MKYLSEVTERAVLKRDENKCALCGSEDDVVIWCLVSPRNIAKNRNIQAWQAACLCTNCRRVVADFFDFRSFLFSEHKEMMRRQRITEVEDDNEKEQLPDDTTE